MPFTNNPKNLIWTAASVYAAPLLQHYGCPYIRSYNIDVLSGICDIGVAVTTALPFVTTAEFASSAVLAKNSYEYFTETFSTMIVQASLPAGLGMLVLQGLIYQKDPEPIMFAIGAVKSSFEVAMIYLIRENQGLQKSPLYGAAISVNIAYVTNTIYYITKQLLTSEKIEDGIVSNAVDYALGYAVARPIYLIAQLLNEANHDAYGFVVNFLAPVSRGVALGMLGKGSVSTPGVKIGVASNVLDGAGIAIGSAASKYINKNNADMDMEISSALKLNLAMGTALLDVYLHNHPEIDIPGTLHNITNDAIEHIQNSEEGAMVLFLEQHIESALNNVADMFGLTVNDGVE